MLEEEDLISELEGLLEGAGEEEEAKPAAPAEVPVTIAIKEISPAPLPPTVSAPQREIKPPAAPLARPVVEEERRGRVNGGRVNGGRVNGGRVNGGRVNGGRVNGGRVNGGRVNGGRVNGGRVNGGRVNGGRVNGGGETNGGRVNGGRVNGGRVNGGRVNGGRVNGGRVNGGRVNGGRVNGGRVNGGRVNGGRISAAQLPPLMRAQYRRQTVLAGGIAAVVVLGLVAVIPFTTATHGPAADGDVSDWGGTGAVLYSDAQDTSLPGALDLREYAIRTENSRLWFEAQAGGAFFTRTSGSTPARADDFLLLLDLDGSASTGYAYHNLGIDRLVEVYGWNGKLQSSSIKAWGTRSADDFAGFETASGLTVAVRDDRIEGVIAGFPGQGNSLANARAVFELRGLDASGSERLDTSTSAATITGVAVQATVTPVAPALVSTNGTTNAPMVSVVIANPSPRAVPISGLRVEATYTPAVPTDLARVTVWRDVGENKALDLGTDQPLTASGTALGQQTPARITFTSAVSVAAQGRSAFLVVLEHVPSDAANGSSIRVALAGPSEVGVDSETSVLLVQNTVAIGGQPLSYVGAAPAQIVADGNTLEWVGRGEATDPTGDVPDAHTDLSSLKGNATASQASFLVSFAASPLAGAIVPLRLVSSAPSPTTTGGNSSGGVPVTPAANRGADVVWLLIEADHDTSTGFPWAGQGYDFAVRIDGKGGKVITDGARLLRWDTAPSPGWTALTQLPSVGVGATALEIGAALPPLVLTARNVTVTAYATNWNGVRDDLSTPLVVGNDQGTRGTAPPIPDPTPPIGPRNPEKALNPIPEFQEVALPIAGGAMIVLLGRRRRSAAATES